MFRNILQFPDRWVRSNILRSRSRSVSRTPKSIRIGASCMVTVVSPEEGDGAGSVVTGVGRGLATLI